MGKLLSQGLEVVGLVSVRFLDQIDLLAQVLYNLFESGRLCKPFDGAFKGINELTHCSGLKIPLFLDFIPFSLQFGNINIVSLLFKVVADCSEGLIGQGL